MQPIWQSPSGGESPEVTGTVQPVKSAQILQHAELQENVPLREEAESPKQHAVAQVQLPCRD